MKHSIAGHLRNRSESIKSTIPTNREVQDSLLTKIKGRSSIEEQREAEEDTTVVEPDQNNGMMMADFLVATLTLPVLSHIISQLRPGADLSRITLPTFILEERSMLERITKYVDQDV